MKFTADLHIHSHYSRATSKNLDFEHLTLWAQLKGVHVVATGDIAHPGWLQEMHEKLEPAEEGLFRLKEEFARPIREQLPPSCHGMVRFVLGGEISNIYKRHDKVRKIHNVVFLPNLDAVARFQTRLEKIGNIRSDGRPILGLDSRDLLEILLEVDPAGCLIPAHIWTPWFAMFGSKSGFDTVEECFGDLTSHIFAVETGLSSDPPMNNLLSELDPYVLVSSSDAHSPQKLAREANLFDCDLSYAGMFDALRDADPERFIGTVEFFPEEGKYHMDGHRKCEIRWDPETTRAHNGICSVCGKPVTVGVMHRVASLADRTAAEAPTRPQIFRSLIPLPEVLGEIHQVGAGSKRVNKAYEALLKELGPELTILQETPIEDIEAAGGPMLAEGVRRMRAGEISPAGGYDGVYGTIRMFADDERERYSAQVSMFDATESRPAQRSTSPSAEPNGGEVKSVAPAEPISEKPAGTETEETNDRNRTEATSGNDTPKSDANDSVHGLNPEQLEAVRCVDRSLVIVAGPGTGKTRTLTHRIAYLIEQCNAAPESILAVTFTNKAAGEMRERLAGLIGTEAAERITVRTFHAFGAEALREMAESIGLNQDFMICSEDDRRIVARIAMPELGVKAIRGMLETISDIKNCFLNPDDIAPLPDDSMTFAERFDRYEAALHERNLLDFDDLILRLVRAFETHPELRDAFRDRFRRISVDEYQDMNPAQHRLLTLLVGPETNLCVIGDPDQAIYGFRGADRSFFLRFDSDFPGAALMRLTRNYRSARPILDASGQVISATPDREPSDILSHILSERRIDIHAAATDKAEAEHAVHRIESMVGGTSYFSMDTGRLMEDGEDESGRAFSDFAVLYRTGAQSELLAEAFERSGIPFQIVGGTPLRAHAEVRAVLSCLWHVHDPENGFHRELLEHLNPGGKDVASRLEDFVEDVWSRPVPLPVTELIDMAERFLREDAPAADDADRSGPVDRLLSEAVAYGDRLRDFLEGISLGDDSDEYDPRADRVTLMTLHASKGLEFPVVIIVGCEETILPYEREGRETDIDEERRLLYVGMTRAKERLILTHAGRRMRFGRSVENPPSRFLNDIEESLKERSETRRRHTQEKTVSESDDTQLALF